MSERFVALQEQLELLGQTHIFSLLPGFSESHPVAQQLFALNIGDSIQHMQAAESNNFQAMEAKDIKPLRDVTNWDSLDTEMKGIVREKGISAIRCGSVAAVIMSGGQGTRLGFDGPKGMYCMGMPSGRCIFRMHMEKLLAMRSLASLSTGTSSLLTSTSTAGDSTATLCSLPVYIMTSDINTSVIKGYFHANDFFGYPETDVYFFEQALEPCMDFQGKLILESETSLAMAPDGNGGIYNALKHSGALADMSRRGVEHLHIYGVDNILTKSADPRFIGMCIHEESQIGNKVVWRANQEEKVGVTVEHAENGSMLILEYSEVPKILADATDEEGKLVYGAGNICNHYVRVDFLINRVLPTLSGIYHLAKKKIPFLDPNGSGKQVLPSANNGYKLEMYVFDIFPLADKWTVLEVNREEEFAPVKNEPGNSVDSPDTARQLLSKQAIRWLHAAGAKVINNNSNASGDINSKNIDTSIITGTGPEPKEVSGGVAREDVYSDLGLVEISPLISYEGEGLEHFLGQVVHAPCFLK